MGEPEIINLQLVNQNHHGYVVMNFAKLIKIQGVGLKSLV
jgi:hypothetical protein